LLYGVKHETGEIRAYRADRIEGAEAKNITFSPRFAIELTAVDANILMSRVSVPKKTVSIMPKRNLRRKRSRVPGMGAFNHGPRYIFRCPVCQKTFIRNTNNPRLNRHKTKYGTECPGTTGYLEEVR
jgi:hypothetical protein